MHALDVDESMNSQPKTVVINLKKLDSAASTCTR